MSELTEREAWLCAAAAGELRGQEFERIKSLALESVPTPSPDRQARIPDWQLVQERSQALVPASTGGDERGYYEFAARMMHDMSEVLRKRAVAEPTGETVPKPTTLFEVTYDGAQVRVNGVLYTPDTPEHEPGAVRRARTQRRHTRAERGEG